MAALMRRLLQGLNPLPCTQLSVNLVLPLEANVRHNSNSASITRTRRGSYKRTYPTLLVFPDGSTVHIRYHEPRRIIKLPLDFSLLSDSERRKVLANRKPKEKLEVVEDFDDSFDANEYSKYWNK